MRVVTSLLNFCLCVIVVRLTNLTAKRCLNDYLFNAVSLSKVQSSADKTNYPTAQQRMR